MATNWQNSAFRTIQFYEQAGVDAENFALINFLKANATQVVEISNSYISLAEMDAYVRAYYLSIDPLRIQWESLDDYDKEVYLHRAYRQINALPYTGRPKDVKQKVPFPRHDHWTDDDWEKVKCAQAEQSIALSDTVAAQEVEDRLRLRRAGVKSYRIGDLQETFRDAIPEESNANYFGLCEAAYTYLQKWLRGGYRVCTAIKPHYGIRWYLL